MILDDLRREIARSGLSLREIAGRAGVDVGNLSRTARGLDRGLGLDAVAKVCDTLKLEIRPTKGKRR